jgi:hypothetical protein
VALAGQAVTRLRLAALVLLTALVVALPRPVASSVPFSWSPAPSAALHDIPAVGVIHGEPDLAGLRGAPLGALNGRVPDGRPGRTADLTPLVSGAPPFDANTVPDRTSANEASTPSPKQRVAFLPATATPSPATLVGLATWYATSGPGEYAAAGPALRTAGWRGSHVVVTGFLGGRSNSITVALTDWCQCLKGTDDERLIDVSPSIFLAICGPLSLGKCKVEVQW